MGVINIYKATYNWGAPSCRRRSNHCISSETLRPLGTISVRAVKISVDSPGLALVKLGASHDHLKSLSSKFTMWQCISMYINVSKPHHIHINFTKLLAPCISPGCYSTDGTKRYDLIASWQKAAATHLQLRVAPRRFAQVMRKIPGERLAEVLGRWYYAQQDPDTYRTGISY